MKKGPLVVPSVTLGIIININQFIRIPYEPISISWKVGGFFFRGSNEGFGVGIS